MTAPDPSMTPDELRGFWKRVDERCGELGITYTQLAQATGVRSAHLAHLMHIFDRHRTEYRKIPPATA